MYRDVILPVYVTRGVIYGVNTCRLKGWVCTVQATVMLLSSIFKITGQLAEVNTVEQGGCDDTLADHHLIIGDIQYTGI